HKDSAEGELLGSFRLSNTNGEYKTLIATMSNIEGMNNIAFVGKLGSVSIDSWFAMSPPTKPVTPTPEPDPEPEPEPVTPTPTPDPEPVTPTPTPNPEPEPEPVTPTPEPDPEPEPIVDPTPTSSDLGLDYTINDWGSGYLVNFKISNNTGDTVNNWKLKIKKSDINIAQLWCANVTEDGDYYVFTPYSWNSTIYSGADIQFGIIGTGSSNSTINYIFE
ncbi:MAG: cellulose binding domain-containing protein, partial [Pseudobutyrivibrio sp.]|nr:cellulose binding domain-containing protein [Pseudobutyrivibrio sp.]